MSSVAPQPPYYTLQRSRQPCLVLAADGTHAECETFVRRLVERFGAVVTEVLDAGPTANDKEKGYRTLLIEGEEFLLMRERDAGMCLWGPKPPASPEVFLRIAAEVGATEHRDPLGDTLRWAPRQG